MGIFNRNKKQTLKDRLFDLKQEIRKDIPDAEKKAAIMGMQFDRIREQKVEEIMKVVESSLMTYELIKEVSDFDMHAFMTAMLSSAYIHGFIDGTGEKLGVVVKKGEA